MTLLSSGDWAFSDDSGAGIDGTVFNAAKMALLKASIEALIHSTTNSALSPKQIIDEVVTARGSKSSLDARLDISLNEDGTLKTQASLITVAQIQEILGHRNLVRNHQLDFWSLGGSAAPDWWTFAGAGGTITRTGTGLGDTFNFGAGRYAAKLTRAGTNVTFTQDVIPTASMGDLVRIRGRTITVVMLGKTSLASQLRVVVDDGVLTTASSFHTGNGLAQALTAVHTISGSATKLSVRAEVNSSNGDAYVGGFMLVMGSVVLADFNDYTPAPRGRIFVSHAVVGNVGAGEDVLATFTMPGGTLDQDGMCLRIVAWGITAANANAKTVRLRIGSALVASIGTALNNDQWILESHLIRTGASAGKTASWILASEGTTVVQEAQGRVNTTDSFAADIVIQVTGEAVANDDIQIQGVYVELVG